MTTCKHCGTRLYPSTSARPVDIHGGIGCSANPSTLEPVHEVDEVEAATEELLEARSIHTRLQAAGFDAATLAGSAARVAAAEVALWEAEGEALPVA